MNHKDIELLILRAIDGESLTDNERATIDRAMKESIELRIYEAESLRLKQVLDVWPDMDVSPDWERSMEKKMKRMGIAKEASMPKMSMRQMSQYIVLVVLVVMTFGVMNSYVKRGLQGRLKSATDDIGDQFTPWNTANKGSLDDFGDQYDPRLYQQKLSDSAKSSVRGKVGIAPEVITRKIVRNVHLHMNVDDAFGFQSQVNRLVAGVEGIIENSKIDRQGDNASGVIIFKVLPKHLEGIVQQIKMLGVIQSENSDADDVTGQYVDIEARLNNWKAVRARLSNLLTEKAGKIKDVLEIERELARVTGEIEAMERRLKVLVQTTAMATVKINFYEQHEKPYKFLEGYSFKDRLRNTLELSVKIAVNTFNGIVLGIGFFIPVAFWSVLIWLGVLLFRKLRKK